MSNRGAAERMLIEVLPGEKVAGGSEEAFAVKNLL
jgi:hypothetical protein